MLKGISLPHLSLSRNSSPSTRSPATPTGLNPSSNTTTHSRPTSDEAKSRNSSADRGSGPGVRRRSIGAVGTLGAAIRRTSSFRSASQSGASTPTALSTLDSTPSGGSSRATSDSLLPPKHHSAHSGKPRSKSSAPAVASTRGANGHHRDHHHHTKPPGVSRHGSYGASAHQNGGAVISPMTSSGAQTPVNGIGGVPTRAPPVVLHNLAESYVGKVNLRLGDAVNKVFVTLGGSVATKEDAVWKGKIPPRYLKARELGDVINQELRAALHDPYLLRTLLRTPVLKALSVFLSRLSTLLLPPPSDFLPTTAKDLDPLNLPLWLRYNLQIVRCCYELKYALSEAPAGLSDVLAPWMAKLDELINRVINPLLGAIKKAVVAVCARARVVEPPVVIVASSTAGLLDAAKAAPGKALLIGRGPAAAGAAPAAAATSSVVGGPAWIRDLSALLGAVERLFGRMECGKDGEKWLVSVGTCAVWKGVLALCCRRVAVDEGGVTSALCGVPAATAVPHQAKVGGLWKSKGKVPSPPESPTMRALTALDSPPANMSSLPSLSVASSIPSTASPSNTNTNFIRLLGEMELFELRLRSFVASALPVEDLGHETMPGTCANVDACGLCKTGRVFDVESSSDEEDGPGGASRGSLMQCAMREAMQVLSACIVVVRATGGKWGVRDALRALAAAGAEAHSMAPATPMALLSLEGNWNGNAAAATSSSSAVTCPTLLHALDTLPTLLLLHLLVSRLPPSVPFHLPHEVWDVDWSAYMAELRGFTTAEEMTPEIAWELSGEMERVVKGDKARDLTEKGKEALEVLGEALRCKAGVKEEGLEV